MAAGRAGAGLVRILDHNNSSSQTQKGRLENCFKFMISYDVISKAKPRGSVSNLNKNFKLLFYQSVRVFFCDLTLGESQHQEKMGVYTELNLMKPFLELYVYFLLYFK